MSDIIIPVVGSKEFLASVPVYDRSKDYLGPFLHGGYRITVAGPIGHGKTSFLMEAAASVARGDDFLGLRGAGVPVVFLDLEMGVEQIGQAMRDARLPHANFDVVSLPGGLAIDSNLNDRRLIQALAERYRVVVIDPWHKLVAQELGESAIVGRIVKFLDGLKAKYSSTCMMIGCHAQEPQTPRAQINLGSISGFKAFQRNADIILTFQRLGGNTSRIKWVKNRSPRLGVKMEEKWLVEWSRGNGFVFGDEKSAREQVLDILTGEWQTTTHVAESWGRSRKFASDILNKLAVEGKVGCRGNDEGGSAGKVWRLQEDEFEGLFGD